MRGYNLGRHDHRRIINRIVPMVLVVDVYRNLLTVALYSLLGSHVA